jgi:hypothetical protein
MYLYVFVFKSFFLKRRQKIWLYLLIKKKIIAQLSFLIVSFVQEICTKQSKAESLKRKEKKLNETIYPAGEIVVRFPSCSELNPLDILLED